MGDTITRADIIRDAIRWAKTIGAVKDGSCFYEMPLKDEPADMGSRFRTTEARFEPWTTDLIARPELREKVCGVCIAGAVHYAQLARGLNPIGDNLFRGTVLNWLGDAAEQVAAKWPGLSPQGHLSPFTRAIEEGGTDYIVAVLEAQLELEQLSEPKS